MLLLSKLGNKLADINAQSMQKEEPKNEKKKK